MTSVIDVNPRDRGLVLGIGSWGLAANMVNHTVGVGIFVLPALNAKAAGAWAPVVIGIMLWIAAQAGWIRVTER